MLTMGTGFVQGAYVGFRVWRFLYVVAPICNCFTASHSKRFFFTQFLRYVRALFFFFSFFVQGESVGKR
jgi:hypothetical protein